MEIKRSAFIALLLSCAGLAVKGQALNITGDQYHLYGPNSTWSQYLQVGGNGQVTDHAFVAVTNGNLHLDSRVGFGTYINHYNKGNTYINPQGGRVGIGTTDPTTTFEVRQSTSGWTMNSRVNAVYAGEINGLKFYSGYIGDDKWAGIASIAESLHSNKTGLALYSGMTERLRISGDGNVGIGTILPESKLRVVGGGVVIGRNATANDTDGNLSIGDISMSSSPNHVTWTYGTSMLISGLDFTTIGFHDAGERVDFIRSGKGTIELGYDGGWGHANIGFPNGIWSAAGNLGLGTITPTERLTVNGKIKANEIRVDGAGAPDYVFEEDYKIGTLKEVESYIKINKHLPEVPSAKEFERDGMALGEMNKLLLKKIEELTLHLIEKDKVLSDVQERLLKLEKNKK